jgi:hemerythrin-like domain-containing protein
MALAHNLMIRYLNSIYLQASGVEKTKDISDFLFYCQTWCSTIHEHHEGEEKGFFPRIDEYSGEKGVMEDAVDEHKTFTPGLNDFQEYVGHQTKPEEYDGKKIRSLIDAFAPALVKHLRAEISKLIEVGEKFGGDKIQTTFDTFEAELLTKSRKLWDPVGCNRPECYPDTD